jgi:hypothetical protein
MANILLPLKGAGAGSGEGTSEWSAILDIAAGVKAL